MTTTASKHGLRAAATERRNKHAQRTALPARPGQVQAARDAIREQNVAELIEESPSARYGMMTVVQLKAEAKSLGLVTYTLRTKGALLNAILLRLRETPEADALAEAKVDATFSGPQPGDQLALADDSDTDVGDDESELAPAEETAERLDGKSGPKAERFADKARALGWKAVTFIGDRDYAKTFATRENESIEIEWEAGVFNNQTCLHTTPGGRALKLRNASHALKRMALAPVDVVREDTKVGIHRVARPGAGSGASGTPSTPRTAYFADDVPDTEVLASVEGKSITWVNGISGALESDTVSRPSPTGTVQMKHPASGRAISFLGSAGFRTVRVSAIVSL
jgi:hypothetical protein